MFNHLRDSDRNSDPLRSINGIYQRSPNKKISILYVIGWYFISFFQDEIKLLKFVGFWSLLLFIIFFFLATLIYLKLGGVTIR